VHAFFRVVAGYPVAISELSRAILSPFPKRWT